MSQLKAIWLDAMDLISTSPSSATLETPGDSFTYTPLDSENEQDFRLLELPPGNSEDPIECHLINTTRDDSRIEGEKLSYEALSYAWEDTKPTKPIKVNGSPLKVTVTLEAALRCLRSVPKEKDQARRLWIDAMCIDQHSIRERNHQVRQMQEIYASADHVNVWLGAARDESDVAMDFVKELCDHFDKFGVHSKNSTTVKRYQAQDFKPGLEKFLTPSFEAQWTALTALFQRPWWGRAWVVQEVASAKTIDVLCGERSLPWPLLALVSQLLHCCDFDLMLCSKAFKEFYRENVIRLAANVVEVREIYVENGHFRGLYLLLAYNRRRHCQDPRDKVFSIMGLTDNKTRKTLTADYSKPVAWVFAMAVKDEIHCRWDLSILHEADRKVLSSIYPSWVPDFDQQINTSRFQLAKQPFAADKNLGFSKIPATFSSDLRKMYVEGFCVSSVDDNNVQRAQTSCLWIEWSSKWTWDVDAMVSRLISRGGVRTLNSVDTEELPDARYRRVKAALYQVMMLGHVRTRAGIQKIEDSDHEEIFQRAQDPTEAGKGGFRGKTQERTVIHSADGHLGMASKLTRPGDKIFILYGLDTPAILRRMPDGEYLFICTCYVHGIMQGEAVRDLESGVYTSERLVLC